MPLVVTVGVLALVVVGGLVVSAKCLRRAPPGHALVVSTPSGVRVRRGAAVVMPIVRRADPIDLRVRVLRIERKGREAIVTGDGAFVDIGATFRLKINDTDEDIIKVAQTIGCDRASDLATLHELFEAKFVSALKVAVHPFRLDELHAFREQMQHEVMKVVGFDLCGFVLEDVAIDHLEPTPPEVGGVGALGPFR